MSNLPDKIYYAAIASFVSGGQIFIRTMDGQKIQIVLGRAQIASLDNDLCAYLTKYREHIEDAIKGDVAARSDG